jgi:hypothetical protein
MATVFLECATEEQRSVVVFFYVWAEGLDGKDTDTEMFPIYCGKCLSRLFGALKNHVGGKRFADDEEVETEVGK